MEMMNIIDQYGRNGYRRSWEMLIEFLARYLGLMTNPWVYSDPSRDYKRVIDRTNPRRVSAFQIEFFGPRANSLFINRPDSRKPHYIFYFAHNYRIEWVSKPKKLEGEEKKLYNELMKKGLLERYVTAARKDPWDHLGDIFEIWMLAGKANRLGQILTPRNIIEFIVQSTFRENHLKLETVLDPCTGTGRFLLVATLDYPNRALALFGIEIDLTLYRACLVNMALFSNHPYYIVCADTFKLNDTMDCYKEANLWNPPDMSRFFWSGARELKPHRHISFEELMEAKRKRLEAEKALGITEPIVIQPKRTSSFFENYVKSRNKK